MLFEEATFPRFNIFRKKKHFYGTCSFVFFCSQMKVETGTPGQIFTRGAHAPEFRSRNFRNRIQNSCAFSGYMTLLVFYFESKKPLKCDWRFNDEETFRDHLLNIKAKLKLKENNLTTFHISLMVWTGKHFYKLRDSLRVKRDLDWTL